MDIQQSLDHLTAELVRRGLPRAYIERLSEELDDHIADLIDQRRNAMSMDAGQRFDIEQRMGSTSELAIAAHTQYRRRTFWGRHPIFTFLVAPVPITLLSWIGFLFAALWASKCVALVLGDAYRFEGTVATEWPPLLFAMVGAFLYLVVVAPPLLAVCLFAWLARRAEVGWRWTLCAVLLVSLLAGLSQCGIEPPLQTGRGQLFLGFGTRGQLAQLGQFLLPLFVGLWLALRPPRCDVQRGTAESATQLPVARAA